MGPLEGVLDEELLEEGVLDGSSSHRGTHTATTRDDPRIGIAIET